MGVYDRSIYAGSSGNGTQLYTAPQWEVYLATPVCTKEGCPDHLGDDHAPSTKYPGYCWNCVFWQERVDTPDPRTFVEGGTYLYLPKPPYMRPRDDRPLGFAGRVFHIRFFDDREDVTTNNLWSGGRIPQHFKAEFPDTAEFVPTE